MNRTSMTRLSLGALSFSALSLTACGGAQGPSPALYQRLESAPSAHFEGSFDFTGLTPATRFGETLNEASLGRSVALGEGEGAHMLAPASVCASLLPSQVSQDYRDRLDEVFDEYVLASLKAGQSELALPKLGLKVPVEGQAKSLASIGVGLERLVSFRSEQDLKAFDRCCELTATCGEKMIGHIVEVKRDARVLPRSNPALQTALMSYESAPRAKRGAMAEFVYRALLKAKREATTSAVSHVRFRDVPKPVASPLTQAKLSVTPSKRIKCKPKKSKSADAIEFTLKIEGAQEAGPMFGYEVKTSTKWVDLSLGKSTRLVKVGTGKVRCAPGPEAFDAHDNTCPDEVLLVAFPPACDDVKEKGSGAFEWSAEVSVYAPGDEEHTPYHTRTTNTVITEVHKR